MKFRNTYIFAALFLAMGAYLYFVEGPRQEEDAQAKKLLQLKPDEVVELTLTYPDKQIVLKKTAAGWQIQKPIEVEADQVAVTNMISALADAEIKRTLEGEPTSLELYGLDKPTAIISIGLATGKTLPAVRLGKTAPIGYSAYAQLEGSSEVKIVASVLQSGMQREIKDLRSKTIIDFKDEDVQSIEITTPDAETELVRDGAGWKIVKPAAYKADSAEVRTLLASVKGVRAENFVDEPAGLSEYGLDKPRAKIAVIIDAGKTRKEIWIGPEKASGSKNVVYVKQADSDTVYEAGTWIWAGLDKSASSLRDKTVLAFDLDSLATVEVTRREGEAYRLVKEKPAEPSKAGGNPGAEPTWKVDGAKASRSAPIGELIADLHGLKGYEVAAEKPADLAAYGLADPDVTFSLIDAAEKPVGRILVSQVTTGGAANTYAMADGGDIVLHLRGFLYTQLDKKKEDFVETTRTANPDADPK